MGVWRRAWGVPSYADVVGGITTFFTMAYIPPTLWILGVLSVGLLLLERAG